MKRTGEVVLGVIGALFYGVMIVFGGGLVWLQSNDELMRDFLNEMAASEPELSVSDFEMMFNGFASISWMILISAIAAVLVGILAMVLVKGNKSPKAAGIIFIATSVIVAFTSLGIGIFAGIFYLIAGIMCLVRKPKQMIEA